MGILPWHYNEKTVINYFLEKSVDLIKQKELSQAIGEFIRIKFSFCVEGWEDKPMEYEFYIRTEELQNFLKIENVEILSISTKFEKKYL